MKPSTSKTMGQRMERASAFTYVVYSNTDGYGRSSQPYGLQPTVYWLKERIGRDVDGILDEAKDDLLGGLGLA